MVPMQQLFVDMPSKPAWARTREQTLRVIGFVTKRENMVLREFSLWLCGASWHQCPQERPKPMDEESDEGGNGDFKDSHFCCP